MKMKRIHCAVLLVICMYVLTGCGTVAKKYDKNTLIVGGNGSLTEVAIEDFKGTSVNADNLETYIEEQIDQFNGEQGNVVKKTFLDTEDLSKVKLVLKYKDMTAYNGFNLLECQLDSFENMKEDDMRGVYTSVDGKSVKYAELSEMDKTKVLVLSEATDVVIKGKILYYNEEVSIKDDLITTKGDKNAIIIFK